MRRKISVVRAALFLVVTAQPSIADGRGGAGAGVERQLALSASEIGAKAMRSEPPRDESSLSAALADTGPAGYATVEKLLTSGDHVAQRIALAAIENKEDPELVPLLRRTFFEGGDSWLRGKALERLRHLGAADTLLAELVLQTSAGPDMRRIAIENMTLLGPDALPALAPFLDTEDPDSLRTPLESIAGWGEESALSVVLGLQMSEDPQRRDVAPAMLGAFAHAVVRKGRAELLDLAYRASTRDGRRAMLRGLTAAYFWHDRDNAFVLDAATSSDARTRQLAAAALEHSDNARAETTLKALLEDPSQDVRWQAAISLARIGVTDGVPLVLDAMAAGYRLDPPPPPNPAGVNIFCRSGQDLFEPAKSAMVRLSRSNLDESAEGDASVWRQWWLEVKDDFDPVEVQLDRLLSFGDRVGPPSIRILARGDASTAARLLNMSLEPDLPMYLPLPAVEPALIALARRHGEVANLLVSAVADSGRRWEERRHWLRVLLQVDPDEADRYLVSVSGEELAELVRSNDSVAARPAVAARLSAMRLQ